jgi:hypothetical protein
MQQMDELSRRNRAQLRGGIPATPGSTALFDMLGADRR